MPIERSVWKIEPGSVTATLGSLHESALSVRHLGRSVNIHGQGAGEPGSVS